MSVISILAKLPNEIKERISNPTALRINNDYPGLYLPKEKSKELEPILKDLKKELETKRKTEKVLNQIELVSDLIKTLEEVK